MYRFKFTFWEDGKKIADALGLTTDRNSRPEIYEWYLTFDNMNDSVAFTKLLFNEENEQFVPHKFSAFIED